MNALGTQRGASPFPLLPMAMSMNHGKRLPSSLLGGGRPCTLLFANGGGGAYCPWRKREPAFSWMRSKQGAGRLLVARERRGELLALGEKGGGGGLLYAEGGGGSSSWQKQKGCLPLVTEEGRPVTEGGKGCILLSEEKGKVVSFLCPVVAARVVSQGVGKDRRSQLAGVSNGRRVVQRPWRCRLQGRRLHWPRGRLRRRVVLSTSLRCPKVAAKAAASPQIDGATSFEGPVATLLTLVRYGRLPSVPPTYQCYHHATYANHIAKPRDPPPTHPPALPSTYQ